MSEDGYRVWCLVDGETEPFSVYVLPNADIENLRDVIQLKTHALRASDVALWKLKDPIPISPIETLAKRSPPPIPDFCDVLKELTVKVSDSFPQPSTNYHLHTIVKISSKSKSIHLFIPMTLIMSAGLDTLKRPHSSDNLTSIKHLRNELDSRPAWLVELHSKIWKRQDLLQELFCTVEITIAHYEELERRLMNLRPERCTPNYQATVNGVLTTKLAVLRMPTTSTSSSPGVAAYPAEPGDENKRFETKNNDLCFLFPNTITFLDLTSLKLQNQPQRMPQPLLVRKEYNFLSNKIDSQPKDGRGSVIISGQPGTGKTAYLHLLLVQAMIKGTPFLYQTLDGKVYHISNEIVEVDSWSYRPIVAFIDADVCEPKGFIRRCQSIQMILATSPKGVHQKWLKQLGDTSRVAKLISELWSRTELLLTGLFLHSEDLLFDRLQESTYYFGHNPHHCFKASISLFHLIQCQKEIKEKIRSISHDISIFSLLSAATTEASDSISHLIFELSPENDMRLFGCARIGPVSNWALNLLLLIYEDNQAGTAAEFYRILAGRPDAAALRSRIFGRQVLRYFDSLKEPHVFLIRSLKTLATSEWQYPGPADRIQFQSHTFTECLTSAVDQKTARHLVPSDPKFPALDSVFYHPDKGLYGIQATISLNHPVAVPGLQQIHTVLEALQPSISGRQFPLIFVVPADIANVFTAQPFKDDTITQEWAEKVDQYVLGITDNMLWSKGTVATMPTVVPM